MIRTVWCILFLIFTLGTALAQENNAPATTNDERGTPNGAAQSMKKAKHVYTTEDMKPADPADSAPSSASVSSGDPVAANTSTMKDEPKSGKKAPVKKPDPNDIAAAQAKVDRLKKQQEGLNGAVQNIQRLIAQNPARQATMSDGLNKQQSDFVDATKKRAEAEQQLNALQNPK